MAQSRKRLDQDSRRIQVVYEGKYGSTLALAILACAWHSQNPRCLTARIS